MGLGETYRFRATIGAMLVKSAALRMHRVGDHGLRLDGLHPSYGGLTAGMQEKAMEFRAAGQQVYQKL